jgi:hypothetical protein
MRRGAPQGIFAPLIWYNYYVPKNFFEKCAKGVNKFGSKSVFCYRAFKRRGIDGGDPPGDGRRQAGV